MIEFSSYIESLKKDVTERSPKNEAERGFKMAVMLIYSRYNNPKHKSKTLTVEEIKEEICNAFTNFNNNG